MPAEVTNKEHAEDENKIRAFIAIPLLEPVRKDLNRVVKELQHKKSAELKRLRWLTSKNYHLTLAFLGDMPESRIEPLHTNLLASLAEEVQFSINTTEISPFPARRPHVLAVMFAESEKLLQLYQQIVVALDQSGLETEHRKLLPHLTLARSRNYNNWMKSLTPVPVDLELAVDTVTLYRSMLSTEGAQHDVVFEIPLV